MKKLLIALTAMTLIIALPIEAQRIAAKAIKVKTLKLPSEPLPNEYSKYCVNVIDHYNSLPKAELTTEQFAGKFSFNKFNRVASEFDADFVIQVDLYQINVNTNYKSDKKVTKTEATKGTSAKSKTTYSYYYIINGGFSVHALVKDKESQEQLAEFSFSGDKLKYHNTTSKYSSSDALNKYWSKNRAPKMKQAYSSLQSQASSLINDQIRNKIDTKDIIETVYFINIKKSKGYDITEIEQKNLEVIALLEELNSDTDFAKFREKSAPYLEFYQSHLSKLDPNDKKQAKIYYSCASNATILSIFGYDYENADKYMAMCLEYNVKKMYTQGLKGTVDNKNYEKKAYNQIYGN